LLQETLSKFKFDSRHTKHFGFSTNSMVFAAENLKAKVHICQIDID